MLCTSKEASGNLKVAAEDASQPYILKEMSAQWIDNSCANMPILPYVWGLTYSRVNTW